MGWFNRQLDMLGFQILPDTNQKHGLVATEFYQVLMIHKFDMEDWYDRQVCDEEPYAGIPIEGKLLADAAIKGPWFQLWCLKKGLGSAKCQFSLHQEAFNINSCWDDEFGAI